MFRRFIASVMDVSLSSTPGNLAIYPICSTQISTLQQRQGTIFFIKDVDSRSVMKSSGCLVLDMDNTRQPELVIPDSRHDGAMLIRDLVMTKDNVS